MKTAVICIARNENDYIREFAEHYLRIGFSKVIIYDNGFGDEPSPAKAVAHLSPSVEIIKFRNIKPVQNMAYNDAYARFGKEFDWLAFFDVDEFLLLEKDDCIQNFLKRFPKNAQVITINWETMTDGGLLSNDGRPLMERFRVPLEKERHVRCDFPENCHVKCIVKGGLQKVRWYTPHFLSGNLVAYHSNGLRTEHKSVHPVDYLYARLRHFPTKTIEEWCANKAVRCRAYNGEPINPMNFFLFNEKTPEKEMIMEKFLSSCYNNSGS